jgi:NMD protein affecting ribosome stability and mRNA decay
MGWSIDEINGVMEKFVKQKVPVSYPVSYPVCQICTRQHTFSAGSKG